MLINEFDLKADEFSQAKPKSYNFYWRQVRKIVQKNDIHDIHLFRLMRRHKKGFYEINPNFTIVIK